MDHVELAGLIWHTWQNSVRSQEYWEWAIGELTECLAAQLDVDQLHSSDEPIISLGIQPRFTAFLHTNSRDKLMDWRLYLFMHMQAEIEDGIENGSLHICSDCFVYLNGYRVITEEEHFLKFLFKESEGWVSLGWWEDEYGEYKRLNEWPLQE